MGTKSVPVRTYPDSLSDNAFTTSEVMSNGSIDCILATTTDDHYILFQMPIAIFFRFGFRNFFRRKTSSRKLSSEARETEIATRVSYNINSLESNMGLGGRKKRGPFLAIILVALAAILFNTKSWDDSFLRGLAQSYRERVLLIRGKDQSISESATNVSSTAPLDGIVILVTGSTTGIGRSLARWTFREGATVVAMGRSKSKLAKLREELVETEREDLRFFPIVADMADLASVSTSVDVIGRTLSSAMIRQIDIVVCNAGMWHSAKASSSNISSKQGYELTFGVNYLSHFLLTEKLMHTKIAYGDPDRDETNETDDQYILSLKTSRVVQVSSSFHMGVDGTALSVVANDEINTSNNEKMSHSPLASRTPNAGNIERQGFVLRFLMTSFLNQRQYANSKLAQLLHARMLNRQFFNLENEGNNSINRVYVPFVSACPGWVGTKIMRSKIEQESWRERLFYIMTYDVDGYGLSSILKAMFDPLLLDLINDDDDKINSHKKFDSPIEDLDYYPNQGGLLIWLSYVGDRAVFFLQSILTNLLGTHYVNEIIKYSRDILATIGCLGVMATQSLFKTSDISAGNNPNDNISVKLFKSKSSTASYNRMLQSELYGWSANAIADYL